MGAGSAGSTLASRLSEEECVSVLLLEAGKKPPLLTDIPGLARSFWFTNLDWQYKTVPQKHTGRGHINRQLIWPSGKAIGGSSVLNAMKYVRGNRKNYDDWAEMGATGWNYEEVLPYFKKMEDNKDLKVALNGYHGVGGPLTVETFQYNPKVKNAILEATRTRGYKIIDEPNGPTQTGFDKDLQGTLRNGQRCSTAKAYLVPAENHSNIHILPNAHVRKVVISNKRATGVTFDFTNNTHFVKARREVILSAGTTNSAQILMLSGIGPSEHLQQLEIPVEADLPVGNNFHDHPGTTMYYTLDSSAQTVEQMLSNESNIQEYINKRTGPLSSGRFSFWQGFVNGLEPSPALDFPDVSIVLSDLSGQTIAQMLGLKPEFAEAKFNAYKGKPILGCSIFGLQPKSRGTVRLRSTDPYEPPLIDPNYLEHPEDLKNMMNGMRICDDILLSEPARKAGVLPFETRYPGCETYASNDDRYLECFLRTQAHTFSHQVGTCRMGDAKNPSTVVDPLLRVKGIQGLRVVDASIMPIVPSGNTNVPTIMVAEKAADIIKSTIHCNKKQILVPFDGL